MQFEDITTIGVVGAGQMGRGISQVCATAGYHVLLLDVTDPALTEALSKIRGGLGKPWSVALSPTVKPGRCWGSSIQWFSSTGCETYNSSSKRSRKISPSSRNSLAN